ncbi:MAG TPA: glycosyltransferase family A protein [Ignavibacteria bacterium]
MKYSIITPTKNEVKYITKTLDSVVKQSVLPVQWIIINDGSDDGTDNIIKDYLNNYDWITTIKLQNFQPSIKATGGRVAFLLNYAIAKLDKDLDLICKLDSDIEFEYDFFEKLLIEFNKNSRLGVSSGLLVYDGKAEKLSDNYTRGASLIVRKEILEATKGFYESKSSGEDTLIAVAARYFGWETKSFPIYFNHLKKEYSRNSFFYESFIAGFYRGSIPYNFLYFLLSQIKYILATPIIIGTILQLIGYFYSRFIRKYRPFPDYIHKQVTFEQKETLLKYFGVFSRSVGKKQYRNSKSTNKQAG